MLKLKKIIVIWPYNFSLNDWDRIELGYLAKSFSLEVHCLVNLLSPHFHQEKELGDKSKFILKFNSLTEWKQVLISNEKKFNLFILNFNRSINLKSFFVNYQLKAGNLTVIEYYQSGVPNVKNFIFNKIKNSFQKKMFFYSFSALFFRTLEFFFSISPNYKFIIGADSKRDVNFILGNSWDYSRYLRFNFKINTPKKPYAVYIDGAGPMFKSDSLLFGSKDFFTSEVWYPSLSAFFSNLEKTHKLKVIIASHISTSLRGKLPHFGNRPVFNGKTMQLIRNSSFVITRGSTAISFAVIFKKPILFIYSDQLKSDQTSMQKIFNFGKLFNSVPININDPYSPNDIKRSLKVDTRSRLFFKKYYLCFRSDFKPNYKILIDEVINKNEKKF